MNNSKSVPGKVLEKRMLTATPEQWEQINSVLFKMEISVPFKPFDIRLFINSESGLNFLNFNSLLKLTDLEQIIILNKILKNFGLVLFQDETTIELTNTGEFNGERFQRAFDLAHGEKRTVVQSDKVISESDVVISEKTNG